MKEIPGVGRIKGVGQKRSGKIMPFALKICRQTKKFTVSLFPSWRCYPQPRSSRRPMPLSMAIRRAVTNSCSRPPLTDSRSSSAPPAVTRRPVRPPALRRTGASRPTSRVYRPTVGDRRMARDPGDRRIPRLTRVRRRSLPTKMIKAKFYRAPSGVSRASLMADIGRSQRLNSLSMPLLKDTPPERWRIFVGRAVDRIFRR